MTLTLDTALYAAACIAGGCAIGLLCRIKTDYQIWQSKRRRMDHRKLSFKRPFDRGHVAADFVMLAASFALMLAAFHYLATK